METLEETIRQLPLELKQEAMDFIQFLLNKYDKKKGGKLSLDWAGGLREYRDQFTSLELQEKSPKQVSLV
ncbi:MAG: DUF2281 domain-containing protein [Thermoplasmata archaeon]|nr:DUF2281 domain-containing protein [Thermoplasmata archaeon]